MANVNVRISPYQKESYEGYEEWSRFITSTLQEMFEDVEKDLAFLNLHGNKLEVDGAFSKFVIVSNGFLTDEPLLAKGILSANKAWGRTFHKRGMYKPCGKGVSIVTPEGGVIAEYIEELNVLNILFDIVHCNTSDHKEIFVEILKKFICAKYGIASYNEWDSKRKEEKQKRVMEKMKQQLKSSIERQCKEAKQALQQSQESIAQHKRKLVALYKGINAKMKAVSNAEEQLKEMEGRINKELKLTQTYPKLESMEITEEKIIFNTVKLTCATEDGDLFNVGKFKIEINIDNADVRFFGDTPAHGYWTNHDPHPHVDGHNGRACLGNVDATIAELCAQFQLYALATILVDFLENANIQDPAGEKVYNWEKVN